MKILLDLAEQLKEWNVEETDSLEITLNEGEPAFIRVRSGIWISSFRQNETLERLIKIDQIHV